MENEQNEIIEEVVEKQPETNELPNIVQELKAQFEAKIEALKDAYGKQIAERDTVIKQLLNDDETAVERETIVDKINNKRKFKKW